MDNLGKEGFDRITGFSGVITQKAYHVTGCVQYGIRGRVNSNNEIPNIKWFDISRVIIGDRVVDSLQSKNP